MNGITDRQMVCLMYIARSIEKRGCSPSLREIVVHMGGVSTNGANAHLRFLRQKGLLTDNEPGKNRAYTLTEKGWNIVRPGLDTRVARRIDDFPDISRHAVMINTPVGFRRYYAMTKGDKYPILVHGSMVRAIQNLYDCRIQSPDTVHHTVGVRLAKWEFNDFWRAFIPAVLPAESSGDYEMYMECCRMVYRGEREFHTVAFDMWVTPTDLVQTLFTMGHPIECDVTWEHRATLYALDPTPGELSMDGSAQDRYDTWLQQVASAG